MATRTRTRNRGTGAAIYTVFLLLYILLLAIVIIYVLKQVWKYEEDYEKSLPEPVIEQYMQDLNANLWGDSIAQTVSQMPHPFQTEAEVSELVKEMLSEGLTYRRTASSGTGNTIAYDILCGGNAIGKVTLQEDESKAEEMSGDLLPWKVASEEFDFSGLYSSTEVTAPASYIVKLNGYTLGEEYITERDIHFDNLESYYYEYSGLPTKVTYHADHIMGHIDPIVYDEFGNEFVYDESKDDSQYMVSVNDETRQRLDSFLRDFSDAYLRYSSNVSEPMYAYNLLLPYLKQGSEFQNKMQQAAVTDNWSHNYNYQFLSSEIINAVTMSDHFYVVEFTASASAVQPIGPVEVSRHLRAIVDDSGASMAVVTVEDV